MERRRSSFGGAGGVRNAGFGFRVSGFGFRFSDFVFEVSGSRLQVSGFGFGVLAFSFRLSGLETLERRPISGGTRLVQSLGFGIQVWGLRFGV